MLKENIKLELNVKRLKCGIGIDLWKEE